jgi:hypothetical protein
MRDDGQTITHEVALAYLRVEMELSRACHAKNRESAHIDTLTVSTMTSGKTSPLLQALSAHQVRASVADFDHYRVHGGLLVETDYIISVLPSEKADEAFESFK